MRIAFFVGGFPWRTETFVVNQIAGLLDRGMDVHVYANAIHAESELHARFRGYELLRRTHRRRSPIGPGRAATLSRRAARLLLHGWRHPLTALRALDPRFGRAAASLDLADMALHLADCPAYDVVHCHFGPNGNDAAMLMDLGVLRGALVVTFHSYDVLLGVAGGPAVYARLLRRADAIHSISEYNRRHLRALGAPEERIVYHPMGIDTRRLRPARRVRAADAAVEILTVARLAPAKGLVYALEALARVRRRRPGIRFRYRVIGGGALAADLVEQARRLRLADVVQLLGPRDQDAVHAALRASDLFLLPSLAEALPLAIMEAMAFALPVVATGVGGVGELVIDGETGRLVAPGDADALADALIDLLDDRAAWRRLGEAGRARVVQRHDIETLNDRLVEHYRTLVSRRAGGARPAAGRAAASA